METYGEPRDGGDLWGAEGRWRLTGSRGTAETYGEPRDGGDLRGAEGRWRLMGDRAMIETYRSAEYTLLTQSLAHSLARSLTH